MNDLGLNAIEMGLTNPDFEISGCEFHVAKLKGLQGFRVFEKIRVALGRAHESVTFESDSKEDVAKAMISVVTKLQADDVEAVFRDLMPCIDVKLPNSDVMNPYSKMTGVIYEIIDPLDIYEIIVRAVAVNFMESFLRVLSRAGLKKPEQETADIKQ
jgi:hypothetical protein